MYYFCSQLCSLLLDFFRQQKHYGFESNVMTGYLLTVQCIFSYTGNLNSELLYSDLTKNVENHNKKLQSGQYVYQIHLHWIILFQEYLKNGHGLCKITRRNICGSEDVKKKTLQILKSKTVHIPSGQKQRERKSRIHQIVVKFTEIQANETQILTKTEELLEKWQQKMLLKIYGDIIREEKQEE